MVCQFTCKLPQGYISPRQFFFLSALFCKKTIDIRKKI